MKIAILHEMLIKLWGAEKVVENWMQLFPDAPIYTLMYDETLCWNVFPKYKIHRSCNKITSQKIYKTTGKQRLSLPFMRRSVQKLDFSQYDVVLVSSSGFAHALNKQNCKTIVYYHAPARYMWDWTYEYRKDIKMDRWIRGFIYWKFMKDIRVHDYHAAQKHDIILSNSETTYRRVLKYYRRESEVVFPPIETNRFAKKLHKTPSKEKYYIILSALTEFKRIDVAINHFPKNSNVKLYIIGKWDHKDELQDLSKNHDNIVFLWPKYGDELVWLVQNSLGLIFPWEEDFWIVPIEFMAAWKPVFALKKWWLTETVIEWKTWDFFLNSEWKDFEKNFNEFHTKNLHNTYLETECKKRAKLFDKEVFEKRILSLVKSLK